MVTTITAKRHRILGWRFTDAWLSMAGCGDKGLAQWQAGGRMGHPGRRVATPWDQVFAAAARPIARQPSTHSRKYMDWLRKYAPPGCLGMDFYTYLPFPGRGKCGPADLLVHGICPDHGCTRDPRSTRTAPPNGVWPHRLTVPIGKKGMKLGYQDCGSWTFMKSTPLDQA